MQAHLVNAISEAALSGPCKDSIHSTKHLNSKFQKACQGTESTGAKCDSDDWGRQWGSISSTHAFSVLGINHDACVSIACVACIAATCD